MDLYSAGMEKIEKREREEGRKKEKEGKKEGREVLLKEDLAT